MTTVTIWHNIATDFAGRSLGMMDGYQPGHPLVPVARYSLDGRHADEAPISLAQEAFDTFNVGDGDDPSFNTSMAEYRRTLATVYREHRNRSLSTGDVVQIDDLWLACAAADWDRVDPPTWVARNASAYGTTALHHDITTPRTRHPNDVHSRAGHEMAQNLSKTFEAGIAVVDALVTEFDLHERDYELRWFASNHLQEQGWPKNQGISSSDVSHHLAHLANHQPDLLRAEAERLRDRNELVTRVAANTGKSFEETLRALQRLLTPDE